MEKEVEELSDAELDAELDAALAEAEAEDERMAQSLAASDGIADRIAQQAVSELAEKEAEDEGRLEEMEAEYLEALAREEAAAEIPTGHVYDYESLVQKHGGVGQILKDLRACQKEGYFTAEAMAPMEEWLDVVSTHMKDVRQNYAVIKHKSGSRLVLIGTVHVSRPSTDFVRDMVRLEEPECLVLERRMGDDSLQRLTVPEELYQGMAMSKAPSTLKVTDSHVDRTRKFQEDRAWLDSSPGWLDIGSEAAVCQEFGAAFHEFTRQRREGIAGGPRGGTVCFGDSDLRPVFSQEKRAQGFLPPSTLELGDSLCMPLRDLQLAQAMRAALRTHKKVVGIVGKGHLAGIVELFKKDKSLKVIEKGMQFGNPKWMKDFQEGGKKWQREVSAGACGMFTSLAESADEAPFGTFIDAEGAMDLERMHGETEKVMRAEGLEKAEPVAPRSSEICQGLCDRGLAITPRTEKELLRWLNGEVMPKQMAGDFPFENRKLRKAPPPLPGIGFPETS